MRDPGDRGDRRDPKTAQDAPGAILSRGAATPVFPLFATRLRPGGDPALANLRAVEDDVDAATPVDAQNAPTGIWKSRKEREIPTAPTSIIFSLKKKNEREQNHSDQLSTESDHRQGTRGTKKARHLWYYVGPGNLYMIPPRQQSRKLSTMVGIDDWSRHSAKRCAPTRSPLGITRTDS